MRKNLSLSLTKKTRIILTKLGYLNSYGRRSTEFGNLSKFVAEAIKEKYDSMDKEENIEEQMLRNEIGKLNVEKDIITQKIIKLKEKIEKLKEKNEQPS